MSTSIAPTEPIKKSTDAARADFCRILQFILSQPAPKTYACPCCGQQHELFKVEQLKSTCMFSQLDLTRYRCCSCDSIFGPIALIECPPRRLHNLYECLYSFYQEGFSQPFQEKTFYLLNPSRRGKYLNYACGQWSEGVEHLHTMGWQVSGFEPFQSIHSTAIVSSSSQLTKRSFDGLFSHNYIEHVQNPSAFFLECRNLLLDSGKMAHSSPCYEYVYEVSPLHLFFPCGDSIDRLAARTGFRRIGQYRADQDLPGQQYVCSVFEVV